MGYLPWSHSLGVRPGRRNTELAGPTISSWHHSPALTIVKHLKIFISRILSSFTIVDGKRTKLAPVTPSWTAAKVSPWFLYFHFLLWEVSSRWIKDVHSPPKANGLKRWGSHGCLKERLPWRWGPRLPQIQNVGGTDRVRGQLNTDSALALPALHLYPRIK